MTTEKIQRLGTDGDLPAARRAGVLGLPEFEIAGAAEVGQQRLTARLFTRLLTRAATEIPPTQLVKPAIVFSPHPDDECLGCGGTILKKKEAGARVSIVHLTDGGASHPRLMSKQKLSAIRAEESRNAAAVLGADKVHFLNFEDSNLSGHGETAIDRVASILQEEQPAEVFVPLRSEPRRQALDHIAATDIVMAALRRYPHQVTVWEYPIWFWLHWPWVGLEQKGDPSIKFRHVARNSVNSLFGLRAFRELRHSVDISDVLSKKFAALAEHRSQMTRLIPDPTWTTLGQVSHGQFLQCFRIDHELFRCSLYPKPHDSTRTTS